MTFSTKILARLLPHWAKTPSITSAQAEAHAREAQLPVARLIEDLAKKVGCLVTRLDTKKQGSK